VVRHREAHKPDTPTFARTFRRRCAGVAAFAALVFSSHCVVAEVAPTTAPSEPSDNPEVVVGSSTPVAVRLGAHTLFDVTNGIGSLSTAQRAAAIEKRLNALANGDVGRGTLRVVDMPHASELFMGDVLIRTLTDQDAVASGTTRQQLANDQADIIRAALAQEFRDRDASHLLRSAITALIATVVAALLFGVLRRLYGWTHARLNRAAGGWRLRGPLERLTLLDTQAIGRASRSIARALAWLFGALIGYVYLEYVLSLFPWTREFASQMSAASNAAVVSALWELLNYLPKLVNIVVIVAIARFVLGVLKRVFEQIASEHYKFGGFYPEWAMPTYSLVRFFVIAVATVMVFPYLPGSGSEGFRGVSAFLGLMVSFGAAPAIANLIAGIIITYMRPFKVTDRVKIADATGDILGKDLLVVRMRTVKNVDITIPNSLVLANHIINFSSSAGSHGLILHTTVTIGYNAPWKDVHALLIEAAKRVVGVLSTPAPFVLQTALDDSYVAYEINAYTDIPNDMTNLYSRLHESIQDVFNAAGVEILSPRYAAVRDGNRLAIPEDYLPKDYRAPGFNLLTRVLRRSGSE